MEQRQQDWHDVVAGGVEGRHPDPAGDQQPLHLRQGPGQERVGRATDPLPRERPRHRARPPREAPQQREQQRRHESGHRPRRRCRHAAETSLLLLLAPRSTGLRRRPPARSLKPCHHVSARGAFGVHIAAGVMWLGS